MLWKEDIQHRPVSVVLAGRDIVIDTKVIRAYLTGLDNWALKSADWTNVARQDAGLDVLWLPDLDHGQVFKAKGTRSKLFEIVQRFCDG